MAFSNFGRLLLAFRHLIALRMAFLKPVIEDEDTFTNV